MNKNLATFCAKIAYTFSDPSLLLEAVTHPSASQRGVNYQRLEFLGDKVLGLAVGEFLIKKYTNESEGELSRRQAALVSGETLSQVALVVGLEDVIQLGTGEQKTGGKTNKKNLENVLEALIGAIYLDSGYDDVRSFVTRFWKSFLDKDGAPPKDPVSELQELIQMRTKKLPEYITVKQGGSDHAPLFNSTVNLPMNGGMQFSSSGTSKKEAQRKVAKLALESIQNLGRVRMGS